MTPLGLHSPSILAQAGADAPRVVVRTRPLVDRQLLNVDLIPYLLRDNQRRPPPSVSDRLAPLVTEACAVHGRIGRTDGHAAPLPAGRDPP